MDCLTAQYNSFSSLKTMSKACPLAPLSPHAPPSQPLLATRKAFAQAALARIPRVGPLKVPLGTHTVLLGNAPFTNASASPDMVPRLFARWLEERE